MGEIADYVVSAYRWQRAPRLGGTPRLPLGVAVPDPLVERAIGLSGANGITAADLRRGLAALAKDRLEKALWRLEEAGMIARTLELRPDAAGRPRKQVIWRAEASTEQIEGETGVKAAAAPPASRSNIAANHAREDRSP